MVEQVITEKKPKKKRCPICKKKLKLTDMECRCGNIYCLEHRLPEAHCCTKLNDCKNNAFNINQNKLQKEKTVCKKVGVV